MDSPSNEPSTIVETTERTTGDTLLDVVQLENARQNAEDRYSELFRAFTRGEIAPQEYHYQKDLLADYLLPKIDRELKTLTGEINISENGVVKRQKKLGRFVAKLLGRNE